MKKRVIRKRWRIYEEEEKEEGKEQEVIRVREWGGKEEIGRK